MNSKFSWKSAGRSPKLDPNAASGLLYSFRLLDPGASSYLNTFDELYLDLVRIGAQSLSTVSLPSSYYSGLMNTSRYYYIDFLGLDRT